MKYRHIILAIAAVALLCMVLTLSNRLGFIIGYYGEEQAFLYLLLAITMLGIWTALETVAAILRARLPRCPACGHHLAGKCPECGHPA